MFTFDIKAIRNEYKNLSLIIKKENNTASEKDLTAMARVISNEDIQQIFSEQHGGIVDAISKTTDNAIFTIILDNTKGKLVLSPLVAIKDPNGIVAIIWNIKDGIMGLLKWVTECSLIKVSWQKILYQKILTKFLFTSHNGNNT